MNVNKIIEKTAAIVVSYNPFIDDFIIHLNVLKEQFPLVIVVDNSDDFSLRKQIGQSVLDMGNINFIPLEANLGIAKAQNIGVKHCIELGFEFFCEFDQDSKIDSNFIVDMVESYISLKSSTGSIAGIGPATIDSDTGQAYKNNIKGQNLIPVATTLSSGFFVPVEAYLSIGSKMDELFIDLVDWEWCFRAKDKGLITYINPNVIMSHKLGEQHWSILGLFSYGEPSPFRHYFAFRNYIFLLFLSHIPLSWKIKYLFINTGKIIFYPLIMTDGITRFKYMCRGIYDGITRKTGSL